MSKFKKIAATGIAFVGILGFAAVTNAASITNIKFDNGQTTRDCTAGQSVNFTARITVPSGEVAEKSQVDVISDSLAPELAQDIGGTLGIQEGQSDLNLVAPCPQNTGYYAVEVRTSGIFGGQHSNSITDGVVSVGSFPNALRVVASSNTTTGGTSAIDALSALVAQLAAQVQLLLHPVTPPAPAITAACSAYVQANAGTQMGVYNSSNIRLQGFLLSQGASIPALVAGASFGFYGPQTQAAVSWFQSINHCQ